MVAPTELQPLPCWQFTALFFVGLSSWLLVSGVFAAAAWAVKDAPEKNALFSHLDVAVQTANLVPAILVLLTPKGWVGRHSRHLTGLLLALGTIAALWLLFAANFHTATASVGLLVGSAASGILGCTSMIAFFPYAASFGNPMALTALSVGVGGCGLVAFVLSALSKTTPILSHAQGYFGIVLFLQLIGIASFFALGRQGKKDSLHPGAELVQPSTTEAAGRTEPLSQTSADLEQGKSCTAGWLQRHIDAIRRTTLAPLIGIMLTAMLQYAMPGLLPYLCPKSADGKADVGTLFLLTAFWNGSALPGRILAGIYPLQNFCVANLVQALIMAAAIVCSSSHQAPPLSLALPAVIVFSMLHGLVVTACFLAADATGGLTGTAYCGLFNQIGAWSGSMLSLAIVALKLSKL